MLLAGGLEAHFALPVEPCVPSPGVHLQDRLEPSAATIDAALHEVHGSSPYLNAGASCWLRQFGQYQGACVLTGFGLRFRHLAQVESTKKAPGASSGTRFRAFAISEPPIPSFYLARGIASCGGLDDKSLLDHRDRAGFVFHSRKVVVPVHAVKSSRSCGSTS